MIAKIVAFFMKKNVQKIVLGAIVVAACLIMLKKYMDSKKTVSVSVEEGVVEEAVVVAPTVMAPPMPRVVDARVSIEQDPVKDLGAAPMEMPGDEQYARV